MESSIYDTALRGQPLLRVSPLPGATPRRFGDPFFNTKQAREVPRYLKWPT
jgi:hypothetical protein